MIEYDGPTLRAIRESAGGVPLRKVSRLAAMSHGHLSKVERGETGRPVAPAILAAYERATGVRLTDGHVVGFGDDGTRLKGKMSDARRLGFRAQVASVAVGGPVGEPISKLIDSSGRLWSPDNVTMEDVHVIEQSTMVATATDLRCGGGMASQYARTALRWAVGLTAVHPESMDVHKGLHTAVGWLAHRSGWAAFDADRHDAARHLFVVALDAAVQSGDRDLRGHVLADVAAQHNFLGYPDDAMEVVAMAEGDRRIKPETRMVLAGVAARTTAAAGMVEDCRFYVDRLAESPRTRWADSAIGYALAALARTTGDDDDWEAARKRLVCAFNEFDSVSEARPRALAAARLAILYLDLDQPVQAVAATRQALEAYPRLRSARLTRYLRAVSATATLRGDDVLLAELAGEIDGATGAKDVPQGR